MDRSLVPANTKRSTLILGMFRPMPDLVILVAGTIITVMMLVMFSNAGMTMLIVSVLPMLLAVALVMPIPNYHNTLCAIQSIISFYNGRKKYIWRGWCTRYVYEHKKK